MLAACGGGSSGAQHASAGTGAARATDVSPAGDIPDTQAFVAYTAPDRSFALKVPEGWAQSADGTATVFSDKYNSIRIATEAVTTAPTAASVASNTVPMLRSQVAGFRLGKVHTVRRSVGPVLVVTYEGASAPDPVTGKSVRLAFERYLYWKNGTQVDVTVAAPVGSDNVDPWRIVTDSFAWSS